MEPPSSAGDLPPAPTRAVGQVREGIDEFLDPEAPGRALIKFRAFTEELQGLPIRPSDVQVVLFDRHSVDSFVACLAPKLALKHTAAYVAVDRSMTHETVHEMGVDIVGKVVAMVGVCWSSMALHELLSECECLFVLEAHASVARELAQLSYQNLIQITDCDMSAATLAWNFFQPGQPVPALLRALEDAELGRRALRDWAAFADGFEAAWDLQRPGAGEVKVDDFALVEKLADLAHTGGRDAIARAIEEGQILAPSIEAQCAEAVEGVTMKTLLAFPAWRCALVNNLTSAQPGRVGEHLASWLVAKDEGRFASRCFAAVFEVHGRHVRVLLRSEGRFSCPRGIDDDAVDPVVGPDVSEIAAKFEGCGHPTRAFFTIPLERWEGLWVQPEVVLWDVRPSGPRCLTLRKGELVTIIRRGERYVESPSDSWSYGYREEDPSDEGWIPTLAHTVLVATQAVPPAPGDQIRGLAEGDLIIGLGQKGHYVWGWKADPGCLSAACEPGSEAWYPYDEDVLHPLHAASVRERFDVEASQVTAKMPPAARQSDMVSAMEEEEAGDEEDRLLDVNGEDVAAAPPETTPSDPL